jgi:hypothetical protein
VTYRRSPGRTDYTATANRRASGRGSRSEGK